MPENIIKKQTNMKENKFNCTFSLWRRL